MSRNWLTAALLGPALLAAAVGCGSSSGDAPSTAHPTTSPSSPTPSMGVSSTRSTPVHSMPPPTPDFPTPDSSTPSESPRIKAAITTYVNFTKATHEAQERPPPPGKPYPPGGDFAKYSFDPVRGQEAGYVLTLAEDGVAWRGTPPRPRVTLKTSELGASPYPTVTVTNCPTAPSDWTAYHVKSNKPIPTQPSGAPPPHLITAKIIYHEGRWGVMKTTVDTKHTCEPS